MACSFCYIEGHNVQTCPRVRRCSHCRGRGHDRRNCSKFRGTPPPTVGTSACSIEQLTRLCNRGDELLAHLYWPKRVNFFEANLATYQRGGDWTFTATPYHGVHQPARPTVNFFIADATFATNYPDAAASRGLRHGVLVLRAAVERLSQQPGFAFAETRTGHPNAFGETNQDEYWRYDLGNHKFTSFAELRYARLARLATPEHERLRTFHVPHEFVVAWW